MTNCQITEDLRNKFKKYICEKICCNIDEMQEAFSSVSPFVIYNTVSFKFQYEICVRWVLRMFTEEHNKIVWALNQLQHTCMMKESTNFLNISSNA